MKLSKDFRNGTIVSLIGTLVLTSGAAGLALEWTTAWATTAIWSIVVVGCGLKIMGYASLLKWLASWLRWVFK